jgi:Domain of unknown function (DUF5679)
MYCVTCKSNTETINTSYAVTKNNRNMMKGNCAICGRVKCQFVKGVQGVNEHTASVDVTSGGDLVGMLNKVSKHFQLPLQKFPGELHIPAMNFAGPGTRLEYRLSDDNTPKEWSQPVDRVYLAAYHHDLAIRNRQIPSTEILLIELCYNSLMQLKIHHFTRR